jgi:hypothetical protein
MKILKNLKIFGFQKNFRFFFVFFWDFGKYLRKNMDISGILKFWKIFEDFRRIWRLLRNDKIFWRFCKILEEFEDFWIKWIFQEYKIFRFFFLDFGKYKIFEEQKVFTGFFLSRFWRMFEDFWRIRRLLGVKRFLKNIKEW